MIKDISRGDGRAQAGSGFYKPRNPRKTSLWQILNSHFDTFLSIYEDRFEERYGYLRPVVAKTVGRYLRCGILDYGFARVRCGDCGEEYLVAYSCKCRSVCPSCQKKRQLEFGEFAAREVFAPVPHRQVVLSIPKRIRLHFFRDRRLLAKLARCGWEVVRDLLQTAVGRDDVTPGAVVSIQTFGNMGELHPHLHMIFSWGCFDRNGTFYAAREVPDVDTIEQIFRHRVFRMLLDEGAVTESLVEQMLSWYHSGFSAYVGRPQSGRNTEKLESLAQYIVRGAISLERLSITDGVEGEGDGKIIYRSNRFHPGHGANFTLFDPLDFIAHLAAHIPNRHEKRAIWYGHYSNRSRGDRRKKAEAEGEAPPKSQAELVAETEDRASLEVRRAWAYMVSKVYEVDPLVCPKCGGTMRVISYIQDEDVIYRILNHLGLLEEEPVGSSERAPPDGLPPAREITCVPFFDDLPAGEVDEDWLEAVMNVGAAN